jgi:hypothetical protein
MILGILLVASIAVALLLGVLAKMPFMQLVSQTLAMSAAAVAFWGLVQLVLH